MLYFVSFNIKSCETELLHEHCYTSASIIKIYVTINLV